MQPGDPSHAVFDEDDIEEDHGCRSAFLIILAVLLLFDDFVCGVGLVLNYLLGR